jgi:hypothetical protein
VKVNVLTPVRKGGPYGWGRSLADCINASGRHSAVHLHEPAKVLSAPVWQDADLIHTALPLSVRFWKKPVVLTVHGDYTVENSLWKRMYPAAVSMADAVTTPSRFLKERLGLDLLRIIGQAGKSFDGNLELTVVGGGKYLEPVRKKAAALDVPVRFTGFLNNPSKELGQADVFVYYSTHDNFPVTLLEAMASGLPVLTNDVGAVREIITGGGEGYISVSDEEYAENLCHLLDDAGLRQAMGRRARKKVEEQFSWHTIAKKYIALYDSLKN